MFKWNYSLSVVWTEIYVPRMDHIDREKNVAPTVNAEVIACVRL